MYIPKINLPIESTEHARWLEKRAVAQEALNEEFRKFMARFGASSSAGARQVAEISARDTEGSGLPPGGRTSSVVRKSSATEGAAKWTYGWQGLMPEYWVTLDPAGASYYVTGLDDATPADQSATKGLLPFVTFSSDGKTMYPINVASFRDGPPGVEANAPIHLFVEVHPSEEGEEFTISPPPFSAYPATTAPFYTFNLINPTGFSAVVNIDGTRIYYAGTSVPVNGDDGVWSLEAGYQAAWHVSHIQNWGASAVPIFSNIDGRYSSDRWFDRNVRFLTHHFQVVTPGTVVAAPLPQRIYNDWFATLTIGRIRASVGTAPTGGPISIDIRRHIDESTDVSVLTFDIPAGEHSAVAVDTWALDQLDPGEWLTVNVTASGSTVAGSDLTVQVWAG